MPLVVYSGWGDIYEGPKWLLIYILAVITLFKKAIYVPRIAPIGRVLLFGLICGFLVSIASNPKGFVEQSVLDWVSFLTISLVVYDLSLSSPAFFSLFRMANLVSLTTVIILNFIFLKTEATNFGHKNFLAEFLTLSLLVQFDFFLQCKQRWQQVTILCICFFAFWLLLKQASFAATIGLFCSIFAYLTIYLAKDSKQRYKILVFALAISVLAVIYLSCFKMPLILEKSADLKWRFALWRSAWRILLDHPLGIGPGNFPYVLLDYQTSGITKEIINKETLLAISPHNGYLESVVLYGWFSFCMMIVLFFRTAKNLLRSKSEFSSLLAAAWIFISIDALVAFPLENAYPFFFVALTVGLTFRALGLEPLVFENYRLRLLQVPLILLLSFLTIGFFISRNYEGSHDYSYLSLSCSLYPSHAENCFEKAELEDEMGLYQRALNSCDKILKRIPNHFPTLLLKSEIFWEEGRSVDSCNLLKKYNSLFAGTSSIHARLKEICN
jgi:hypothetical protein